MVCVCVCVPSVPWTCPICPVIRPVFPRTFCPLNMNFHINRPKRPGCPWDIQNLSLGRFRGIPTTKFLYVSWEPVGHLQGSLGLSGPKPWKSLKKVSWGLRPQDPPRVWKKSRKSPESLEKVSKRSRKTFSRLFPECRGVPGLEAPGDFFSDFFRVSGPESPRDPCEWPTGSQYVRFLYRFFLSYCLLSDKLPLSGYCATRGVSTIVTTIAVRRGTQTIINTMAGGMELHLVQALSTLTAELRAFTAAIALAS